MQELQVPIHRITVDLVTDQGQTLAGKLFTSERPFHTGAIQEAFDLLNDERSFVPFQPDDNGGRPFVLGKRHVLRVRIAERSLDGRDERPVRNDDGQALHILTLSDGSRVIGRLLVDTPPQASRVVDKLNAATPFLAVRTDRGVDLVQTAHIVSVE